MDLNSYYFSQLSRELIVEKLFLNSYALIAKNHHYFDNKKDLRTYERESIPLKTTGKPMLT